MKIKHMILTTALGIVILISHSDAASYFTDRGSAQVGGGIIFQSTGYEDIGGRDNMFVFTPIINFFPLHYFLVGPVFDFRTFGRGTYNEVNFGIGGRVGFAYGKNIPVVPFFYGSPQLLINVVDNNVETNTDAGFGMEIHGGLIIPVQQHFSINFGPGFWFQVVDGYGSNVFFLEVSVTGLIF